MPGEEEARGVVRGEAQGGKRNITPAGTEALLVVDGDRVPLADMWLAKNDGEEGSFRSPSVMEGDTRLLEDELSILFCFDRVTGLLHGQNRLQEASMTGDVGEVGRTLCVVGDGTGSTRGTHTGQDGDL